jgi:hypothetical protein
MIEERELAFLEELKKYENKWVAVRESDGREMVVGSGDDAVQAMREAEANGFGDAFLMHIDPFDKGYIPTLTA